MTGIPVNRKSRIYMYIFFSESECWKSQDLDQLKVFVKVLFQVNTDWMEIGVGEKLVFSECENYSLERCHSSLMNLDQIPMIWETYLIQPSLMI